MLDQNIIKGFIFHCRISSCLYKALRITEKSTGMEAGRDTGDQWQGMRDLPNNHAPQSLSTYQ